jgi:hypothetical protein
MITVTFKPRDPKFTQPIYEEHKTESNAKLRAMALNWDIENICYGDNCNCNECVSFAMNPVNESHYNIKT